MGGIVCVYIYIYMYNVNDMLVGQLHVCAYTFVVLMLPRCSRS